MRMLFRAQPGFEPWLVEEIKTLGWTVTEQGGGWVRTGEPRAEDTVLDGLCFSHLALLEETEITGDSVNALADRIVQAFFASAREERFEGPWPFWVETAAGLEGLGRRADAVGRAVAELLKKRMARVAKLATPDLAKGVGRQRGLFVYFSDFRRVMIARSAFSGGQRRMADDPLAPSRSYLKVEEAYGVLGREPAAGERVVDLGAAPGGWSYSAAKRGAHVVAVDNGPLKGGALDHPLIEHRREDAFRFTPAEGEPVDWLFCDLVEEPHHVLRDLIVPWLQRGWCRRFVVILKFGRTDPLALLREVRSPGSVFQTHARGVRVRHLFHDREEFTLVGETSR